MKTNIRQQLEEVMNYAVDKGSVAGVNVLVLQNGKEVAYAQAGYRDLENKIPLTRDTIFRLYSQTKPVTAAAVVLLVSRGLIDIGADLSDYLPEFSESYINIGGKRQRTKNITIRDLMNMTSGLSYPDDSVCGKQSAAIFDEVISKLYGDNPITTMEFAQRMSKIDLKFTPGTKFDYGASADILGAVVEKVAGVSFGTFLQKEFFEPLGMNDTSFYVPESKAQRLAKNYDYTNPVTNNNCRLKEAVTDNLGLRYLRDVPPAFESGGAGLCATLDDYSKFATMLLNKGSLNGKQILSPMAVRFLTHGGLAPDIRPNWEYGWSWMQGYSYGNLMRVCVEEDQTCTFVGKGEYGWDGWLGTFFSNEPEFNLTYLFGVQQVNAGEAHSLTHKLKNIVMNEFAG